MKGFADLVRAAEAGDFEAVVVYDITRGSRDVVDWFSFRKEMQALGVRVLSATEKLGDIVDPSAFLTELIIVGIGQHQVLQSRQKSIDGKKIRAEKGLFCGGRPPLGYDIADGQYVINEREAQAVRTIFTMYASGRSYREIIGEVERMGVVGKLGQKIGTNTLHFILKNERYTGKFIWFNKQMRYMRQWAGGKPTDDPIIKEDIIPRIVDQETWERVAKRMADNKKNELPRSRDCGVSEQDEPFLLEQGHLLCEELFIFLLATLIVHIFPNRFFA